MVWAVSRGSVDFANPPPIAKSEEDRRGIRTVCGQSDKAALAVVNCRPAERIFAASAVVDGKLWLMGGLVTEEDEGLGQEPTASVSIYDPSLDSWAAGPPLPAGAVGGTPGYGWHTAVHAGEIHLNHRRGFSIVCRGGAWEELPEGAPVIHGACESVLLG